MHLLEKSFHIMTKKNPKSANPLTIYCCIVESMIEEVKNWEISAVLADEVKDRHILLPAVRFHYAPCEDNIKEKFLCLKI